jgi:DNA-binding PucR family transcriptional regulator
VRVRVWECLEEPAERLEARTDAGGGSAPGPGGPPASARPEPPLHELLLASVPAPVLRSFSDRLLGPLQEYDDRHNAELTSTLRSFLACDGSWSACASLMYVHVNTVRYRISRVEALTGRDLSALADRVDFFLALRGA